MGLCKTALVKLIQTIYLYDVKSLMMIGRQNINITWKDFMPLIKKFHWNVDETLLEQIKWIEPINTYDFFRMLGISDVHAVDYSEVDGADIIFDLNSSLPDELKGKYDMVLNGGTLEHVFDVANAMKNMSAMVNDGGIIYHACPAFDYVEHGFFSFSPTFFTDFYEYNDWLIEELFFEFRQVEDMSQSEWNCVYSQDLRLFQCYETYQEWEDTQTNLNRYIKQISAVEKMARSQIVCIAKRNGSNKLEYPIQGVYRNNKEFSDRRKLDYNRLVNKIGKCESCSLYGYGRVGQEVYEVLKTNGLDKIINKIFDMNQDIQGLEVGNKKIEYPVDSVISKCENIIVCTNLYEAEMTDVLVSKGVPLDQIIYVSDYENNKN